MKPKNSATKFTVEYELNEDIPRFEIRKFKISKKEAMAKRWDELNELKELIARTRKAIRELKKRPLDKTETRYVRVRKKLGNGKINQNWITAPCEAS